MMSEILEFFNGYSDAVLIIRIVFAGICGGIIGVERTLRQRDAGFRTHIIVAMGAALMMIISKYGFLDIVYLESVQVDVSRVASNIITGISFLGAASANVCAGYMAEGGFDMAGYGRQTLAYPDCANAITSGENLDPKKLCVCCSKCTEIMRKPGGTPGCVIRDKEVYLPLYTKLVLGK